ncbi:MAG: hypothetical protein MRY57_02080 [Candidatus Pacebacteria bacterium]|nr:hypothetical protein [Candidatus Paceibacterota bacterium]
MQQSFMRNLRPYFTMPDLISANKEEQYNEFINFIREFTQKSSDELKLYFVDCYEKFVRNACDDLDSEFKKIDPFYSLTQQSFKELYMIKSHSPFGPERIFTPFSFLFCNTGPFIVKNRSLAPTNNGEDYEVVIDTFSKIPVYKDSEKSYHLGIGFVETRIRENNQIKYILMSAGISLDDRCISLVKDMEEWPEIRALLNDVAGWFNHDLTAHGTLLADYEQSAFIKKRSEIVNDDAHNVDKLFYYNDLDYGADDNPPVFAGEMWSVSIHAQMYQKMVEQNSHIEDYLVNHFKYFIELTENITDNTSKKYLQKVYALMIARIVDPKILTTNKKYDFLVPYSDIFDLPFYEQELRRRGHSNKGLVVKSLDIPVHVTHQELAATYIEPLHEKSILEGFVDGNISKEECLNSFKDKNPEIINAYIDSQNEFEYNQDVIHKIKEGLLKIKNELTK